MHYYLLLGIGLAQKGAQRARRRVLGDEDDLDRLVVGGRFLLIRLLDPVVVKLDNVRVRNRNHRIERGLHLLLLGPIVLRLRVRHLIPNHLEPFIHVHCHKRGVDAGNGAE